MTRCGRPGCRGSKLCEADGCNAIHPNGCSTDQSLAGWRCREHTAESETVRGDRAAGRWALDWATVLGWPTELWCLVLRFAALAGMVPGERRKLDDQHRLGLLSHGEAAAVLFDARSNVVALVLPGATVRKGELVSEADSAELVATLRAAVDQAQALFAEAELYRHAAELIRGGGCHRWTTGADVRAANGTPCEPHPDACTWSLVGAMRQAALERATGEGLSGNSAAAYVRLGRLCLPACFKAPHGLESFMSALRIWNDSQPSALPVLSLLLQAAAQAEREGSGEAVSS